MITTDIRILRKSSKGTNRKECHENGVFEKMEIALTGRGCGLSAIQIEMPIRACIVRYKKLKLNMINPVIENMKDPFVFPGERCLSLPGMTVSTRRYKTITVSWLDYDTGSGKQAVFTDMEAAIIYHEVDHMNGNLMTDRDISNEKKIGRNELCPECLKKDVRIKYKKCEKHFVS